jgi:hypothetical protein
LRGLNFLPRPNYPDASGPGGRRSS